MRKILMKRLVLMLLLSLLIVNMAHSQYLFTVPVEVQGNKTVVIELITTGVEINGSTTPPYTCPDGYNYNVLFDYSIKVYNNNNGNEVGFNNIWTLQGNFVCNDQTTFFNLPNALGEGQEKTTGNQWIGNSSCNSATVESLMCDKITFEIKMKGYEGDQFVTVPGTSVLPVELLYFEPVVKDGTVVLNWTTGSETNNDYFTIECSLDGYNWDSILSISGQGNSTKPTDYKLYDRVFGLSGIVYYRLSQTDYDGKRKVIDRKSCFIPKRKVVKIINVNGQEVDIDTKGLIILIYSNGEQEKIIN